MKTSATPPWLTNAISPAYRRSFTALIPARPAKQLARPMVCGESSISMDAVLTWYQPADLGFEKAGVNLGSSGVGAEKL